MDPRVDPVEPRCRFPIVLYSLRLHPDLEGTVARRKGIQGWKTIVGSSVVLCPARLRLYWHIFSGLDFVLVAVEFERVLLVGLYLIFTPGLGELYFCADQA